MPWLREREHLDELEEVAGVLAADEAVQRQAHPLHVHVHSVVAHGAGHVEQHARRGLRVYFRFVNHDVVGRHPNGQARPGAEQGVDHARGDVHLRNGVAELVGFGLGRFDGPFAAHGIGMPPGTARLHLAEDLRQHLRLKQPHGLGREAIIARAIAFEPLLFGLLLNVVFHLLLQRLELVDVAGLGVLLEFLHVDDRELGRLLGFLDLLEQFVDCVELFLHLEGLGHVQLGAAGEVVLPGEFVDLVLFAEQSDDEHEANGEGIAVVADAEVERFEFV